ncbi:pilus (MSHA type) biogenesis protein MshL [Thalassolituus pacificus]|uniref:Pilus (MSHA type) biogenesis protein MshL n=1 Tax=Thalassolituus pacificus TaxID=2975440 RepID=A0A9X2WHN8_9GAMM|nr:pilus (MSHA type) biogenesis protein MshL [Thalassolituus pacificus]MCT7360458.1 pilus (MSHA type) biogenesis protein MshL [Thalassolituus pacificus]
MSVVIVCCIASDHFKRLLTLALLVLLSGCATVAPQAEKDSDALLLQTGAEQPQADLDLQQLLPPLDQQPASPVEHFDVLADRTPASAFFNSLVDGTGYNLVVHPEVSGDITLNLKNVTLLETLQAVRDIYGFDFVQSAYGIQILPRQQQTRIFPINYLNVKRSGRSGMHVSSGQVTSTDSRQSSTQTNTTTSGSSSQTINSSEVDTESRTDFWQDLKSTLQLMLGQEADAQVVVDAHAGIVVVKAMPGTLNHIASYLEKAELSVQKQVLIEAKIIEVTLSDGFQSGINWSAFGGKNFRGTTYSSANSLTSSALENTDLIEGVFTANFALGDFAGALQLLRTQGEVKVLSSPRIATVNNQKAVIKVGSDEFFVTNVSNTITSTTTGSSNTPDIELTPFFSGIALDVTPQIGSDQEVTLHVHPTVTEVEEKVKTVQLNNDDYTLPLAYSTVRETDSIVRARSGQVVVIGGLMQNRKVRTDASVPWLGNIPLLGWFFRQTREEIVQSELVILIQPKVIDSALTREQIDELNQRYSRLMPARR